MKDRHSHPCEEKLFKPNNSQNAKQTRFKFQSDNDLSVINSYDLISGGGVQLVTHD